MTDVAIVGAGAAGIHAALVAAELGAQVLLISRKPLDQTASFWAQGGLAAALAPDDSPEQHAADTLRAGRGACRPSAVEILAREAPAVIDVLRDRDIHFDGEHAGGLSLGLEGGHSRRRIVHAGGSATGRRITRQLSALAANHRRIEVRENTSAVALWSDGQRCHGVIGDGGAERARATILATGGAAALWSRTSNPWGAIGAGAVLAQAGGAELADFEFCQFHPTALSLPGNPSDGFLITEAIRGEGATLLDGDGERFTEELAPRDAVTEAILDRMEAGEAPHVWLDMRAIEPERFPNVTATLRRTGIDPRRELIPVAPAAHYVMGGIATDLDGRSSLAGLYAVGESSCCGLHGANRLASNSLTECFVFGTRAARAACDEKGAEPPPPKPSWRFEPPAEATRGAVWAAAGPRRSRQTLEPLLKDPYPLARVVAAASLAREESRGAHRRTDHPRTDPELDGVHFVHQPGGTIRRERWA